MLAQNEDTIKLIHLIPVLRPASAKWPRLGRWALVTRASELASMDDDFDSRINRPQHPPPR